MKTLEENDLNFIRLFEEKSEKFFKVGNFILSSNIPFSQTFDMMIMQEILHLEIFLDDYGARNNNKFSYLTELIASIRNFTNIMYTTKHIYDRISLYKVEETAAGEESLKEKVSSTWRLLWPG